jgi:hypothetical protein
MATIKTLSRGNKRDPKSGGYVFLSMLIGLLIAGLAFGTVAGSIALLVRNAATIKSELFRDIEKRNTLTLEKKTVFDEK